MKLTPTQSSVPMDNRNTQELKRDGISTCAPLLVYIGMDSPLPYLGSCMLLAHVVEVLEEPRTV